jgi:hypothetical protein
MKTMMLAAACAAALCVAPSAFAAEPIQGNAGKYMSPFTTDGTTAGWITKSMQVKGASQIGSLAGQYAGQKAMEQVPFVGGFLGKKVGEKVGREVALQAIGGEEFLRASSDLSFASPQDMVDFIKANYAEREDITKILQATWAIYPEVQTAWPLARRPVAFGKPLTAPAPSAGTSDLYRFDGKAGRTITIEVQAESIQPAVMLNSGPNTKAISAMNAPKGAKQVSFNATIPADGEYVVTVYPVSGFFKTATGGTYLLKVSDPVWEKEEADRLAAERAAAEQAAAAKAAAAKAPVKKPPAKKRK